MKSGDLDNCPHCGVSLLGTDIPAEHRIYYGMATHFKREIGFEQPVYDGTLYYGCPDCGGLWHRFAADHPLWNAAEQYVGQKARGAA